MPNIPPSVAADLLQGRMPSFRSALASEESFAALPCPRLPSLEEALPHHTNMSKRGVLETIGAGGKTAFTEDIMVENPGIPGQMITLQKLAEMDRVERTYFDDVYIIGG